MDPSAPNSALAEPSRPPKRLRKEKGKEKENEKEKEKKPRPARSFSDSRLTWALLRPMLLRRGVSEDFKFVIPSEGQTAANPPAGYITWYFHQFEGGLTLPIPSFMTNVATFYGIPLNQLHPTAFKFMTCFFVICKVLNFFPSAQLFFSFFLIKAPDEGSFYLNGRQGNILLTGNAPKIKDWRRNFVYVRKPANSSWDFPLTPPFELNRGEPDPECVKLRGRILNLLPAKHAFNVEQILDCSDLVASTGLWPLTHTRVIPDRSIFISDPSFSRISQRML